MSKIQNKFNQVVENYVTENKGNVSFAVKMVEEFRTIIEDELDIDSLEYEEEIELCELLDRLGNRFNLSYEDEQNSYSVVERASFSTCKDAIGACDEVYKDFSGGVAEIYDTLFECVVYSENIK